MSLTLVLVCFLIYCMNCFAIQGELVSCPACKLNRLPDVKRFFREPGHADSYVNLKVTFIHGKNPDLFIKNDNGEVIEKVDLSPMTTEQIHELLVSKGFERKAAGVSRASVGGKQSGNLRRR